MHFFFWQSDRKKRLNEATKRKSNEILLCAKKFTQLFCLSVPFQQVFQEKQNQNFWIIFSQSQLLDFHWKDFENKKNSREKCVKFLISKFKISVFLQENLLFQRNPHFYSFLALIYLQNNYILAPRRVQKKREKIEISRQD